MDSIAYRWRQFYALLGGTMKLGITTVNQIKTLFSIFVGDPAEVDWGS